MSVNQINGTGMDELTYTQHVNMVCMVWVLVKGHWYVIHCTVLNLTSHAVKRWGWVVASPGLSPVYTL